MKKYIPIYRMFNPMKIRINLPCAFIIATIITVTSCIGSNDEYSGFNQIFKIDENLPAGSIVGQIATNGFDGPGRVFSITDGNTDDAFAVSSPAGTITVKSENAIDYEKNPVFFLVVKISDQKNSETTGIIEIRLKNIEPTTYGLYLHLPFDGNLSDMSPFSNYGIDFTSHKYVQGKKKLALDFNGSSDYVKLSQPFYSGYGLSFSFWLYTRGANGNENNGSIVSKYSMSSNHRCFMLYSFGAYDMRSDNRLSAAFYREGSSSGIHDLVKSYMEPEELTLFPNPQNWSFINPKRLVPNVWTHCVINMTSTAMEAWINGELCVRKLRDWGEYFDSQYEPILIGNNYAIGEGSNNHFNGIIDELRIYYRSLSKEEITTLFKE
jgi:hypothetical protein